MKAIKDQSFLMVVRWIIKGGGEADGGGGEAEGDNKVKNKSNYVPGKLDKL